MKKIVLCLVLLVGVAFSQSFFGINANSVTVKQKVDSDSNKIKDSDVDLKLGLLVPNDYRTYISLSFLSKGSEASGSIKNSYDKMSLMFNYDEFSNIYTDYDYNVDYYVGLQLGLMRADLSYNNAATKYVTEGEMGFAYGLKTGLNVTLSHQFSLELGYKYSVVKLDGNVNGKNISISNESGPFIGFNVIF